MNAQHLNLAEFLNKDIWLEFFILEVNFPRRKNFRLNDFLRWDALDLFATFQISWATCSAKYYQSQMIIPRNKKSDVSLRHSKYRLPSELLLKRYEKYLVKQNLS